MIRLRNLTGNFLGDFVDGAMTEKLVQGEIEASLPGLRVNLNASNRVSTQIEKVIMNADSCNPQRLLPDFGERCFRCSARSHISLTHLWPDCFRFGKRLIVHFSMRREGKTVQRYEV